MLKKVCDFVVWTPVVQSRDWWWTLVNTIIKLPVAYRARNPLTS
jgi:hypothetical protein